MLDYNYCCVVVIALLYDMHHVLSCCERGESQVCMKNHLLSWYCMHELSRCCIALHKGYADEMLSIVEYSCMDLCEFKCDE